jgi:ketosteroid isomerase-like protein
MRRSLIPLIALGSAAIACAPTRPFTDGDRATVRATADTFAARVLRADWAGTSKLYAPGARFMPPNQKTVVGPAAIETWMHSFPPLKSFALTVDTVVGSGNLAYVSGHYAMSFTPPGAAGPVSDAGKFLEVHERQADGSWLNVSDMFNSDQPVMPPPPALKQAAPARRRAR